MTISKDDIRKIANILHTIYCKQDHESKMENYNFTKKCKYYLENTIDRTYELPEHREWLQQAQCLISVSQPLDVLEIVRDFIKVYQIAGKLKRINPKLLNYILTLIK